MGTGPRLRTAPRKQSTTTETEGSGAAGQKDFKSSRKEGTGAGGCAGRLGEVAEGGVGPRQVGVVLEALREEPPRRQLAVQQRGLLWP